MRRLGSSHSSPRAASTRTAPFRRSTIYSSARRRSWTGSSARPCSTRSRRSWRIKCWSRPSSSRASSGVWDRASRSPRRDSSRAIRMRPRPRTRSSSRTIRSRKEFAMPARTGAEYIKGLQEQEREIWLRGERIKDVTTHPGLANGVRAIAALYDLQHDPGLRDEMTYISPTSGERVGLSFVIPRTRHELERRGAMMLRWARTTCGMMGRSPDFMNVTFAAWAAAAKYFGRGRPEVGDNIPRYYEHISERDLTLTHSLINLQRSRTVSGVFNLEVGMALQVMRETDAGIVVHGARILATLGPLADEIAVYSPRVARHTETHSPFALNFAIPCGTPGLKFLCRESFDLGRSHFEHPLGARS